LYAIIYLNDYKTKLQKGLNNDLDVLEQLKITKQFQLRIVCCHFIANERLMSVDFSFFTVGVFDDINS